MLTYRVFLAANRKPLVLYTFQPGSAGESEGEYSFSFDANSFVTYSVSGGATFTHKVWNYRNDSFGVSQTFLGIPTSYTAYLIERRQMDKHHMMILLAPTATYTGVSALILGLYHKLFTSQPLTYYDLHDNGFTRLQVTTAAGSVVSTAVTGSSVSASISLEKDNTIRLMADQSKVGLTYPTVKNVVGDEGAALILTAFHKATSKPKSPEIIYPTDERSFTSFQAYTKVYNADSKESMVPFMACLATGAYVPQQCLANDEQFVNGRILNLRPKEDIQLTPFMYSLIEEFIDQFIPDHDAHKAFPVDMDEVYENQHRPSQRRLLNAAEFDSPPTLVVKSFMKKEAYGKPTDPRPISTVDTTFKRDFSAFIYALAKYLKTKSWYAFAKTPAEIAAIVADICSHCDQAAIEGDFSRFDGRVSAVLRHLERHVLARFFRPEFQDQVMELSRKNTSVKAITTFGVKYMTSHERKSGSPETSVMNTIINKFLDYATRRRTINTLTQTYHTPSAAYNAPGIFGGDDSLVSDVDPSMSVKVSAEWGMVLEVIKRPKFKSFPTFLARIYGDGVWGGDPTSMCDLHRQLSKFHLTVTLPPTITPEQKLMEKARAVLCSDSNTPVIGQLARRVSELTAGFKDLQTETTDQMRIWGVEVDQANQYPNDFRPWMQTVVQAQFGQTFDSFQMTLDKCKKLQDLLVLPVLYEAPIPTTNSFPVVLAKTNIVEPPPQKAKTPSAPEPPSEKPKAKDESPPRKSKTLPATKRRPEKAKARDIVFTETLNKAIKVQAIKLAWKHVGKEKERHASTTDKFATILTSLVTLSKDPKITNHLVEAEKIYASETAAQAVGPGKA